MRNLTIVAALSLIVLMPTVASASQRCDGTGIYMYNTTNGVITASATNTAGAGLGQTVMQKGSSLCIQWDGNRNPQSVITFMDTSKVNIVNCKVNGADNGHSKCGVQVSCAFDSAAKQGGYGYGITTSGNDAKSGAPGTASSLTQDSSAKTVLVDADTGKTSCSRGNAPGAGVTVGVYGGGSN